MCTLTLTTAVQQGGPEYDPVTFEGNAAVTLNLCLQSKSASGSEAALAAMRWQTGWCPVDHVRSFYSHVPTWLQTPSGTAYPVRHRHCR